jgi:addiction module RelE/StbE family toxin
MAAVVMWTDGVLADIEAIATYITQDSEKQARLQVGRFFEQAARLEKHPLSGHIVLETNSPEIQEIRVNSYRIIYRVLSLKLLHILTVYHNKRLLSGEDLQAK